MRTITIHRCPTCETIKGKADQLVRDLKSDPNIRVEVVDGQKGEFAVDVDGRPLEGDSSDFASRIRGEEHATR